MFAFAMFMSLCVDVICVGLSFTVACGVGVSDVYMLKSVGDSTLPCGTPFLNWRCVHVLFLNVCSAAFDVVCDVFCGMFVWCSLCVRVYVGCVECFAHV